MEEVYKFLDENKDMMEKEGEEELEEFFESDEFYDLDENSKREIFYMKSFYKSTKEYEKLENCIKDFMFLIKYIYDNDYLHNVHECYETIVKNYLNQIDDRLRPCFKENQDNFINSIYEFVENLDYIYLPNDQCKNSIIKELKNLQEEILNYKKKINEENKMKFERYNKILDEYITKQENSINDNNNIINSNIDNSIDDEEEKKFDDKNNKNNDDNIELFEFKENNNSKTDESDSFSIDKKNYLNLVQINNKDKFNNDKNKYFDSVDKNDSMNINNDFNNNKINNINSINNINNDFNINNNNFKINSINNINNELNNIGKDDELKFDIINNKSRIYDSKNSLNNSEIYHDSMIFDFSLSQIINEMVESANKEIEEEKVEEIYSEIDNFTNQLLPMFDSNNNNINNNKISFLKKRYLSDNIQNINNNQNNNIININNIQNINNNINLSSSNRPAKKKKKGKKKKKEK